MMALPRQPTRSCQPSLWGSLSRQVSGSVRATGCRTVSTGTSRVRSEHAPHARGEPVPAAGQAIRRTLGGRRAARVVRAQATRRQLTRLGNDDGGRSDGDARRETGRGIRSGRTERDEKIDDVVDFLVSLSAATPDSPPSLSPCITIASATVVVPEPGELPPRRLRSDDTRSPPSA